MSRENTHVSFCYLWLKTKSHNQYAPDDSWEVNALIDNAKILVDNTDMRNWKNRTKNFLRVDIVNQKKLTVDSPLIKFALSTRVITTASSYMGFVPILYSASIWHSRYTPDLPCTSQLYHCDWEDVINVKLFVHVSDITDIDGPTTVIPADTSQVIRDNVKYTYGEPGYRIDDEHIREQANDVKEIALTGPSGTIAFLDTCRCFHYGSRISSETANRTVAVIQFVSPAAINLNPAYKKRFPFAHLNNKHLSELQRYIIGACR